MPSRGREGTSKLTPSGWEGGWSRMEEGTEQTQMGHPGLHRKQQFCSKTQTRASSRGSKSSQGRGWKVRSLSGPWGHRSLDVHWPEVGLLCAQVPQPCVSQRLIPHLPILTPQIYCALFVYCLYIVALCIERLVHPLWGGAVLPPRGVCGCQDCAGAGSCSQDRCWSGTVSGGGLRTPASPPITQTLPTEKRKGVWLTRILLGFLVALWVISARISHLLV